MTEREDKRWADLRFLMASAIAKAMEVAIGEARGVIKHTDGVSVAMGDGQTIFALLWALEMHASTVRRHLINQTGPEGIDHLKHGFELVRKSASEFARDEVVRQRAAMDSVEVPQKASTATEAERMTDAIMSALRADKGGGP